MLLACMQCLHALSRCMLQASPRTCVYACVCIFLHGQYARMDQSIHANHIQTQTCTHAHPHALTRAHTQKHTYTYVWSSADIWACRYWDTCLNKRCVYVCVSMYVCTYVCVFAPDCTRTVWARTQIHTRTCPWTQYSQNKTTCRCLQQAPGIFQCLGKVETTLELTNTCYQKHKTLHSAHFRTNCTNIATLYWTSTPRCIYTRISANILTVASLFKT
jgi:hypothetical protein